MLVAAAVLPHPPLLVPQLAAGAAGELDDLRAACDAAVRTVLDTGPERVVLAGAGPGRHTWTGALHGSLAMYGVPLTVLLGGTGRRPTADLPLALTIGAWLLQRSRWAGAVSAESLPAAAPRETCLAVGQALAAGPERVVLLAMGDGSARRGPVAPGEVDTRAVPYDDAVAQALADSDAAVLAGLDEDRSAELLVAGRAAWQVLAGAAADAPGWSGRLLHSAAPYGVAYHVAVWSLP